VPSCSPNYYSEGQVRACLGKEQIKASWGRGEHCGERIQCINEAFRLFYIYRNRIEQVSSQDFNTYWAMLRELEDAGDTGWGSGVRDLDDAFQHLIANNGHWADENTRMYSGLNEPSVYRRQVFDAPLAAANFLDALNDKLKKLQQLRTQLEQAARSVQDEVAKAKRLCKIIRQANALAWLGPVAQGATEAEPGWYEQMLPWLESFTSAMEVIEVFEEAELIRIWPSVKAAWKVTDWLILRPDAGLQSYSSARQAGMGEKLARAWGALAVLVTLLPVLDDFYGTIIQQSPALIGGIGARFEERQRLLDRAAAGARLR